MIRPTPLLSEKLQTIREIRHKHKCTFMSPYFDKLLAKKFADGFGLASSEIVARYGSINDLPELFDLPARCVIKPVNGNGNRGVYCLVDGLELLDNRRVDRATILAEYAALGSPIGTGPVIVEDFIEDWNNNDILPRDYKFYNFGRRTAFVHIIERHSRKVAKDNLHWFINPDGSPWQHQFVTTQRHSKLPLELPPFFPEMLRLSQDIASHLNAFIRVDLYADRRGPVFGELTPFPHGGKGYMADADRHLGRMWRGVYGASRFDFIKHLKVIYLDR